MSSLIFGSVPVQAQESKLVKLLARPAPESSSIVDILVLCTQSLQYWQVSLVN